ncbi:hypothetical protein [Streptomyces sp. NPDC001070]
MPDDPTPLIVNALGRLDNPNAHASAEAAAHLNPSSDRLTVDARAADVVEHIDHAVNVCAEDHVGIGTDGTNTAVDDLDADRTALAGHVAQRREAASARRGACRHPPLRRRPARGGPVPGADPAPGATRLPLGADRGDPRPRLPRLPRLGGVTPLG